MNVRYFEEPELKENSMAADIIIVELFERNEGEGQCH